MRTLSILAISLALMAASACAFGAAINKSDLIACMLGQQPSSGVCPER